MKKTIAADYAIELKGIAKSLGGLVVHHDLNLQVERGKTTVVVKASGSGKSVMLKYILGFMQPDQGDVLRRRPQHSEKLNETEMKKSAHAMAWCSRERRFSIRSACSITSHCRSGKDA
ncbi:MAG: ATP-binding cassette domain-containing protein [Turneriella sp.]